MSRFQLPHRKPSTSSTSNFRQFSHITLIPEWARDLPLLLMPPATSSSSISLLNLLPIHKIPQALWQQLLHTLLPTLLLDVKQQLQQHGDAWHLNQPKYPVQIIRSISGMAVAQQLQWIAHNLKIEGARFRQQHGQKRFASRDEIGFVIAVPTRNAGMNVIKIPVLLIQLQMLLMFIFLLLTAYAGMWLHRALASLLIQNHTKWVAVVVDDASDDNSTSHIAAAAADADDRILYWRNEKRMGCLANTVAVFNSTRSLQRRQRWPQHEDPVLVVLDGDDWLFDESSLWTVAQYYIHTGCWVTHGSFVEFPSENYILWQRQLHQIDVDAAVVRQADWVTSALRTFRHRFQPPKVMNDLNCFTSQT
jgi:hypothetical protein